jgi:hypothetical protein
MFKRAIAASALAVGLAGMTGCAVNRADANLMAGTDLTKVKTLYVVHAEKDNHDVDKDLKAAFEKRGFTVTTGPAMTPPYPADAVVTYVDKWMWDLTTYMIELTVTVRSPTNDFPMATGHSLHTSLTRKSPVEMADEVAGNIVAAKH